MDSVVRSARRRRPWVYSIAGIAVALLVVIGLGPTGLLLPHATVCQVGPLVGNYTIWTPDEPQNQPEGVNVSASVLSDGFNFTFTSGSLTVGALHPNEASWGGWGDGNMYTGISLQGTENNWSFYRAVNVSVVGGDSSPCSQPYVAEESFFPIQGCGGFVTIRLQSNTSDVVEPHVWDGRWGPNATLSEPPSCPPATPGAYVWFDTSFHANATGVSAPVRWNLCNLLW